MRAALYLRVSTSDQVEFGYGLDDQRRKLTEHAKSKDWEIVGEYVDEGVSGAKFFARQGLQRLLADAAAHKFDLVLTREVSRLDRSDDIANFGIIRREFKKAGVLWGTPSRIYRPGDASDDLSSVIEQAVAAFERSKILDRTKGGREEAARQGKFVARLNDGFRKAADGTLEPDPVRAAVVLTLWKLCDELRSFRAVVTEATERGLTKRSGKGVTRSYLQKMVSNPIYGGTWVYGRNAVEWDGEKRTVRKRTEKELSERPAYRVPRIIPKDLYDRVTAHQKENKVLAGRRKDAKRLYQLRSQVFCGVCDHAMTGKSGGYVCQGHHGWHYINAAKLEAHAWTQVVDSLETPDRVREDARRQCAQFTHRDELTVKLAHVEAMQAKLPEERQRIQRLFIEGYASKEEIAAHLDDIDTKAAKLVEQRRSLESRLSVQSADEARQAEIEKALAELARVEQAVQGLKSVKVLARRTSDGAQKEIRVPVGAVVRVKRPGLAGLTPEQRFNVFHALIERVTVSPVKEKQHRSDTQVDIRFFVKQSGPNGKHSFVNLTS